ncbi:kinase-like protein [Peniophora sp. CONT]|nr:kinase-like protein [Peniophora sp. CONT]
MELMTQGCLRGFIRHIRHERIYLPEDNVRVFAYNVLRAIAAMHAREIIHGDLKPGNILCTSAPGYRLSGVISDLGGAKHTSELQQTHVYVGGYSEHARCKVGKPSAWTRGYSAPELGKSDADARAHDIHCFGATIFELMTKRKLFSEEHYCKLGDSCTNAACPGRRRVYHFTQLREGNFSSQAYVFVKQLVFPNSPSMRLSAAQALAHPWFTLPGEAMMSLAWDFVDETVFEFERDAYVARVEGGRGRVAGPAPSRTEMPSKESGKSTPQKDQKKMDTDQQLYGQDDAEWASEETSASFRVSLDDLEVGQEMHVWRVEHYRHDAADVVPTMDEWQVQLPQADAAAQP